MAKWLKTPKAAELGEFERIDDFNKEHFPIQFFFRETVVDWFSYKKARIRDAYWWTKHRIDPRHRYHNIKTGLKPSYYDVDTLMLHGNFALLVRYVEDEKCFEHINWESNDVHDCVAGEIEDLYHWWKYEYPKREETLDALLNKMYPRDDGPFRLSDFRSADKEASDRYNFLEVYYIEEETYNLKRLIDIRKFLWT